MPHAHRECQRIVPAHQFGAGPASQLEQTLAQRTARRSRVLQRSTARRRRARASASIASQASSAIQRRQWAAGAPSAPSRQALSRGAVAWAQAGCSPHSMPARSCAAPPAKRLPQQKGKAASRSPDRDGAGRSSPASDAAAPLGPAARRTRDRLRTSHALARPDDRARAGAPATARQGPPPAASASRVRDRARPRSRRLGPPESAPPGRCARSRPRWAPAPAANAHHVDLLKPVMTRWLPTAVRKLETEHAGIDREDALAARRRPERRCHRKLPPLRLLRTASPGRTHWRSRLLVRCV